MMKHCHAVNGKVEKCIFGAKTAKMGVVAKPAMGISMTVRYSPSKPPRE